MASEAISEHQISNVYTCMYTYTSDTYVTPLLKILTTGLCMESRPPIQDETKCQTEPFVLHVQKAFELTDSMVFLSFMDHTILAYKLK